MWDKIAIDYSLYLIADRGLAPRDLRDRVEQALHGGVTVVQLRAKELNAREFCALGKAMLALTDAFRVPLVINDRLDIALAVGAAGVHLGQEDLSADTARKILGPQAIVGVSARTRREAQLAEGQGANYVGVGAIFPTATKADASCTELAVLREIAAAISIPVLAIGGISADNAWRVLESGAHGLCVASAILKADSPHLAARELRAVIDDRR